MSTSVDSSMVLDPALDHTPSRAEVDDILKRKRKQYLVYRHVLSKVNLTTPRQDSRAQSMLPMPPAKSEMRQQHTV